MPTPILDFGPNQLYGNPEGTASHVAVASGISVTSIIPEAAKRDPHFWKAPYVPFPALSKSKESLDLTTYDGSNTQDSVLSCSPFQEFETE
jgi:hypothetical protein